MILILFFKTLLLINQVFPECTITDDWKKTYPNLESALRGLDLPAMLPVTSDPASEPGIRTRIFESEEKTTHEDESCSIDRLKFIDAFSDIRCNNDFKETVFESLEDLVQEWTSTESSGYDLSIGVDLTYSAEVSAEAGPVGVGVGYEIKVPPLFSRSETNTDDMKKMEKFFKEEEGRVIHTRAECIIYTVKIDIGDPTLKLYPGFKERLLRMDKIAQKAQKTENMKEVEKAGREFIMEYGTHYVTEAQMGSSLIFESRFDKSDMENLTEEERNKCHKIQGAKILGIQVEKDSNDCKFNSTNGEKTSSQSVDRFQQKSKGSFPPIDREGDGALSEWNSKVQEEVGEDTYRPLPIRRKMGLIVNILNTVAVEKLKHPDKKPINITNVKTVLLPAYNEYCLMMPGSTCDTGCAKMIKMHLGDEGEYKVDLRMYAVSHNDRTTYCREDHDTKCVFYEKGQWHFNTNIGKIEDSIYSTASCPQRGGEFVDFDQIDHSPIYNVKTWQDCARDCQKILECQHWQYSKKSKICHLVDSFDGAKPSKHYFAGHRNCPIWDSKQSLFNLCPGRDERTNMWIDKRTKWNNKKKKNPFNKFYNPYIKLTVDCFEYNQRFNKSEKSLVHYTKSGSVEDCQDKCNIQRKRPKIKGKLCEVWSWNEVKEECDMFSNKNAAAEVAEGFVKGPYDCKFDRDRDEEKQEEDDDE